MAKNKIPAPTREPHDTEYQAECHEALEPFLQNLIVEATKAGWNIAAVDYSLMVLAARNMKRRAA